MSIKVTNTTMVRPAKDTPSKSLWLSRLDMIVRAPYAHNHTLFIYHHPISENNNNPLPTPPFFDTEVLKKSLSNVLVEFYPMAGRLKVNENNGRYEIDCNAEGALFVEADTTLSLSNLGDQLDSSEELRKQMVPHWDFSEGLSSIPLLMVQVTRFDCGGVCLGLAQHHHVADGSSHMHFNVSWARLARGLDITIRPVHDRAAYLGPREPLRFKARHFEYDPSLPPVSPKDLSGEICDAKEGTFKLTKDQIEALKLEATSLDTMDYKLTTFEVLAGHVWRSACKARGLAEDQEVIIRIPVAGRSRLKDPSLPPGYCGNCLFFPPCKARVADITRNPLWYAATKIHETVNKLNDAEYLRSSIDYLESQPDLAPFVRGSHTLTCPNLSMNYWGRMSFDEMDFGWGKPTSVRPGEIKWEGQSVFIPSLSGDGSLLLVIKLFTPHLAVFGKHFYTL